MNLDKHNSASILLKKSAKAIVWLKQRRKRYLEDLEPTERQIIGNENSEKKSSSKFIEMKKQLNLIQNSNLKNIRFYLNSLKQN